MARVVLIKHDDEPCDDRVSAWFAARGYECEWRYPYRGDRLGRVGPDVVATVLYGGPGSIPDVHRFPYVVTESLWVLECARRRVPVLGFCQGAQVIAYALGAPTGPADDGRCEFGYYPLSVTPAGADLLARSDDFAHQAFRFGEYLWAFQFHPEITPTGFRRWQDIHWAPYHRPGAQDRTLQDDLMAAHDGRQAEWMTWFLESVIEPKMVGAAALTAPASR
jgi:GMP synthase (glutamine-hydrolysing)